MKFLNLEFTVVLLTYIQIILRDWKHLNGPSLFSNLWSVRFDKYLKIN